MITVRRVICPVGVGVVRREQLNTASVPRHAVQFADKGHHIRHMLDNVVGHDKIKLVIGERIRQFAQIMNNIRSRARIIIQPHRTCGLIHTAPNVKYLHREYCTTDGAVVSLSCIQIKPGPASVIFSLASSVFHKLSAIITQIRPEDY